MSHTRERDAARAAAARARRQAAQVLREKARAAKMAARAEALAARAETRLAAHEELSDIRRDARASRSVARAMRESDRRTNQQVLGAVLLAIGGNWLLAEFGLFTFGWPGLFAVALMTLGMAMVGTAKARRTKPLIALGIVLTLGLAMSSGVGGALGGGFGDVHYTPASASQLEDVYQREIGDLSLDLRNVDPSRGVERTSASVGIGDIEVIVPEGVAVRVVAVVNRLGDIDLPGPIHTAGISEEATYQSPDFDTADEKLEVSLYTSIGDITVEQAT